MITPRFQDFTGSTSDASRIVATGRHNLGADVRLPGDEVKNGTIVVQVSRYAVSMENEGTTDSLRSGTSQLDALTELGRTTTAFIDAPPDLVDSARKEYENALRLFNATGRRTIV